MLQRTKQPIAMGGHRTVARQPGRRRIWQISNGVVEHFVAVPCLHNRRDVETWDLQSSDEAVGPARKLDVSARARVGQYAFDRQIRLALLPVNAVHAPSIPSQTTDGDGEKSPFERSARCPFTVHRP